MSHKYTHCLRCGKAVKFAPVEDWKDVPDFCSDRCRDSSPEPNY